ncbi:DUF4365 domain-containing protein [Singulisphaera rosea]
MQTSSSSIIGRRSEAMAQVFLTGSLNVEVFGVDHLLDIDQIAKITSESRLQRLFGVIVKGTSLSLPDARTADAHLGADFRKRRQISSLSMPVIILLFSMKEDVGYYAWQAEPVLADSAPKLRIHERFTCQLADDSALNTITSKIDRWYDSFEEKLYLFD